MVVLVHHKNVCECDVIVTLAHWSEVRMTYCTVLYLYLHLYCTWVQVLLGQKYGYRPLPGAIPAKELDMICDVISRHHPGSGSADIQLLQQWYKKDDNSTEPVYVLQTISSILTHFKNKVILLPAEYLSQFCTC